MPRIDPLQLLRCLSVLLSPTGGIKSIDEVQRLASLMTKFSKKLVSKCIYVQILRTTERELLGLFMASGGWNLAHQWLSDAILAQNLPFIKELLELLIMCPISVEQLKTNNCPKLIKNLTKEASDEQVRLLASQLVEQWLKVVKGQSSAAAAAAAVAAAATPTLVMPVVEPSAEPSVVPEELVMEVEEHVALPVHDEDNVVPECEEEMNEEVIEHKEEESTVVEPEAVELNSDVTEMDQVDDKPSEDDGSAWDGPVGTLPVYKITIRDGIQVLNKVSDRTPRKQSFDSATIKQDIPKITTNIVVKRPSDSVDKKKNSSSAEKLGKSSSSVKSKSTKSDGPADVKKIAKDIQKKLLEKSLTEKKMKLIEPSKEKPSEASTEKERTKERKERELNKLKEKKLEKAAQLQEKANAQLEKDKATLAKLVPPPISKLGKIPKKVRTEDSSKPSDSKKSEDKKSPEHKRSPLSPDLVKKTSSSSDSRKSSVSQGRPKTVKSFNSKFRSTGLEEEAKPTAKPPRRSSSSSGSDSKKSSKPDLKRTSPIKEEGVPPEKKAKTTEVPAPAVVVEEPKKVEKPPAKPKRVVLQESDMFMDALCASTKKDVRKRKRRTSISKDGAEVKKETTGKDDTPPPSPTSDDNLSPIIKAAPKFYRDTMDEDEKEEKKDSKEKVKEAIVKSESKENENEKENQSVDKVEIKTEAAEVKVKEEVDEMEVKEDADNKSLRGVLVHHKTRKGPKKSVRWKTEKELETIKFFELDETERVNVTKTFTDMKLMERTTEREGFVLSRKIANEDNMEEKTPWKTPFILELPKEVVEWGVKSQEKEIQYARESVVLSALYFNRASIPDSASEPDSESHPAKDPVLIPLDDPTGSADSIIDFRGKPWPEPKPLLLPTSPTPNVFPPNVPTFPVYSGINPGGFNNVPPMFVPPNIPPVMMGPGPNGAGVPPMAAGDWRTGDGRVVSMDTMPMEMYNQQGGPGMGMNMPPGMGGPMDMNFNMMPNEDMSQHPMQGFPGMHGPPMQGHPMPQGPPMFQQFHGGRGPMGPNMRGNRGGGGPRGQWFRPNGGWQGPRGGGRPWGGRAACHHFANRGSCRAGSKCAFTH